jgi:hypothetical protein
MGTKVGLTGITFGDATVQNTAAVTGVTSLTAGSGISVSGATGAVTVSATGGGVTSLNGQTGAITDTTFGNIGSIAIGYIQDGTQRLPGDTIAGSSVYYPNNNTNQTNNGDSRNIVTAGNYADNTDSTVIYHLSAARNSGSSGAYKALQNMSTLSGTWRFMTHCGGRSYGGSGCGFASNYPGSLLVRVS